MKKNRAIIHQKRIRENLLHQGLHAAQQFDQLLVFLEILHPMHFELEFGIWQAVCKMRFFQDFTTPPFFLKTYLKTIGVGPSV